MASRNIGKALNIPSAARAQTLYGSMLVERVHELFLPPLLQCLE
jgi:hypothetical protein